ncbi:MAG: class I SAM-dependent methyltransferase [Bacteroidia bacterium]
MPKQLKKIIVENCNVCGSKEFSIHTIGTDYEYETSFDDFTYVTCNNCSHLFLQNQPHPDELPIIYPDNYQPYRFETDLNPIVRWFRDRVQLAKVKDYKKYIKPEASIIEVGAGSGILIESLKKFGPPTWKLTANEFEMKRLQRLEGKGIHFAIGNFETIEFTEKYDVIIMNQLIEHLYNPDTMLKRCHSLLNKNGIVIIETPNYLAVDHSLFKNKYWGGYHIPRHFNIYSYKTLKQHLQANNFEIVTQEFLLSPAFWVQSFHHYFYDRKSSLKNFFKLNNVLVTGVITVIEVILKTFYRTSNQRVVARIK